MSRPGSAASVRPRDFDFDYNFNGVLTPSRPASLNRPPPSQAVSPTSKKRKRDAGAQPQTADHLLVAPVVLKPHPIVLTARPHLLHPLMLLPRDNLPLSFLDLSQPHGELSSSRLFDSKIKILDLEGRLGSNAHNVLLSRSETSRAVYAIEREASGLYVVCKLGSWVDIEALSQVATVVCRERIKSSKPPKGDINTAQPLITPQMYKEHKRRKTAIEEIQSICRRRSTIGSESESRPSTPAPATPRLEYSDSHGDQTTGTASLPLEASNINPVTTSQTEPENSGLSKLEESMAQPTAEDIFQNIRTQYFEALYHSMGSLAYFAKGSLSRARAAFHLDYDANLEMSDLIDFLRSLVITTIVLDKKYRETLPAIVEKSKLLGEDSDAQASKSKKRKPKKMKLGKDGLYPSENDHIIRWWATNKEAAIGNEETTITSSEIRYHIECLRRRETQLQMIIILEILALEPLRRDAAEDSQLPGMDSQLVSREGSQEPTARKRNKTNLPLLLDVHADRLCIWQTTMTEEIKALAESQVLPDGGNAQKSESSTSDPLRDFCVDIIVPFFSARLPDICDSLNRKLGGPVSQPTPKEKARRPAPPSNSKPGAPAKRPGPLRKDKEDALEKALSKERMRRSVSRGPSNALALLRSASMTAIPGLKRETSEPLMSMIPRADASFSKPKPRTFLSGRTSTILGEDKAKKKAQVDAELKDAISALRKPNRAVAVKEFVDAADKRASTGVVLPKKLKKPKAPQIVKATPMNNRFRDIPGFGNPSAHGALDPIPSSASMIPSSTMPRKFANMLGNDSIGATPVRPAFHGLSTVMESPGVVCSPIMARKKAAAMAPIPPSSPGLAGLFETPTQSKSMDVYDTPIRSRLPPVNREMEKSAEKQKGGDIYAQLGWT